VALLGTNAYGYPSITWASGPNGPQAPATAAPEASTPTSKSAPAAFYAPAAINNAGDVLAVGAGPGSESLSGFMDNTAIYQILKNGL